jgi:KDO2-lipid IV(A) lauroyltransferase
MAVLAERLRENRVVCLLADRDLSHNGIEVQFFGEPTRMPAGPALLAATTGATLHAVHCYFRGEQAWGASVSAPIGLPGERLREQVTAGMQTLADRFAQRIAEHPADWHMLQRLWLADRPPGRAAEPAAAATSLASG